MAAIINVERRTILQMQLRVKKQNKNPHNSYLSCPAQQTLFVKTTHNKTGAHFIEAGDFIANHWETKLMCDNVMALSLCKSACGFAWVLAGHEGSERVR